MEKRNEFKMEFNNQQFRSGMQGIARETVLKSTPKSEILKLPEHIQDVVLRPPVDTPFKRKGGKFTRRRNRKRQIKGKKRRSLRK